MPERYSEAHLYSLFKQCDGNVAQMIGMDNVPSLQTIHKYKKNHNWVERLKQNNEDKKNYLDKTDVKTFGEKKRVFQEYADIIDTFIQPMKDPETGELMLGADGLPMFAGPEPKDFEKLVAQRLAIARELHSDTTPEAPKQQIVNIIQININAVCDIFGEILKEFIVDGSISEGIARKLAGRFAKEASEIEIRSDEDSE